MVCLLRRRVYRCIAWNFWSGSIPFVAATIIAASVFIVVLAGVEVLLGVVVVAKIVFILVELIILWLLDFSLIFIIVIHRFVVVVGITIRLRIGTFVELRKLVDLRFGRDGEFLRWRIWVAVLGCSYPNRGPELLWKELLDCIPVS